MKIPIWNVLWNTIPLFTMPENILYICIFWQVKHFSSNWRHMYAKSNIVQELINKKYIYM